MCDQSSHSEALRQANLLRKNCISFKPIVKKNQIEGSQVPNCTRAQIDETIYSIDNSRRTGNGNPIFLEQIVNSINEGCHATKESIFLRTNQELKRKKRVLKNNMMVKGPDDAFLDYFPPDFQPGVSKSRNIRISNSQPQSCLIPVPAVPISAEWKKRHKELLTNEQLLKGNNMIMGPYEAFPEYFEGGFRRPSDFDFVDNVFTERKIVCGGDHAPGPIHLNPRNSFMTQYSVSYNPNYNKQHLYMPPYCAKYL